MKRINFLAVLIPILFLGCQVTKVNHLPNILWITSEDNSPLLGCYGDKFATTPYLDKLASEGFLYTHAYANAPVCAPARNTIISGVYANSSGNQHMRSYNRKSELIKLYPQYLREAGYYCTNNSKTDYNIDKEQTRDLWNESSDTAHYKNRKSDQPFFAIFNIGISHEVSIHKSIPDSLLRHRSEEVPIPPYHPATREIKHDWAQYYDKIEDMDTQVGEFLNELENSGEAENTIVFYYSDHGGILARSKRFVYETGTHVPFIIRIPEKFKHLYPTANAGSNIDRLISFVDLAPTLLSIIGTIIPDFMQGNAFLGDQKTNDPEYVYLFRDRMDERYDMCRAVRDKKYRYIHNYMAFRKYGQHQNYLWNALSVQSWEEAYNEGKCNSSQSIFWNEKPNEELYDVVNDPWEINNLANNPDYNDVLLRMRNENRKWVSSIHDAGFIPEAELVKNTSSIAPYDYLRANELSLDSIIDAAEKVTCESSVSIEHCIRYLKNDNSAIRYWGATGILIRKDSAMNAIPVLIEALNDSSPDVAIVSAETLYNLGEKEKAIKTLLKLLEDPQTEARCHALNVIDCLDIFSEAIHEKVKHILNSNPERIRDNDVRLAKWMVQKWETNN